MNTEEDARRTNQYNECLQSTQPMRDNARTALENNIKQRYIRLNGFQVLEKVIPWDLLSKEDEIALYELFSSLRLDR